MPKRKRRAVPVARPTRNRRRSRTLSALLLIMLWMGSLTGAAPAQEPVVRAVLFFSPTCSHCQQVMREIPGVFERYGGTGQVWNETGLPQEELAFFQVYNQNLQFLMVNVSLGLGRNLYEEHTAAAGIPDGRLGVPRLAVVGDLLVGSNEILDKLPGIIERGLAGGGTGWPSIPGLTQIVEATGPQPVSTAPPTTTPPVDAETQPAPSQTSDTPLNDPTSPSPIGPDGEGSGDEAVPRSGADPVTSPVAAAVLEAELNALVPQEGETAALDRAAGLDPPPGAAGIEGVSAATTTTDPPELILGSLAAPEPSTLELFGRDLVGNSLAVVVLVAMIAAVLSVVRSGSPGGASNRLGPAVPMLALIGMGVAAYLTYVESMDVAAVCGPVGNCNAVQQSEYARLFGVVPVGVIGLVGYVAITATWFVARVNNRALAARAVLLLGVVTLAGTLFSIYLTFLEPFVIGATCAWCLTSAVLITILMVISVRSARATWSMMRSGHAGTLIGPDA